MARSANVRSRARSWALNLLYAWEVSGASDSPLDYATDALERRRMAARYRTYALHLLETVGRHLAEIDRIIAEYAVNWRVERLDAIDRNVLRIGVAELRWGEDVPPKVAIQESVRLATRYGGPESSRFVNGVLDAVYREAAPIE